MDYLIASNSVKVSMEWWQVIVKLRFCLYCKIWCYHSWFHKNNDHTSQSNMTVMDINHMIARDTCPYIWNSCVTEEILDKFWTCEYLNVKVTQFWIWMYEYDHTELNSLSFPISIDHKEYIYDFGY